MTQQAAGQVADVADDPICQNLQNISILTREIEKRLAETLRVNATDLAAMEQLVGSGALTPGDLAARLQVTTAAATQIVDRLEKAGHVGRVRHETDRRKVMVVPAAESVALTMRELTPMLASLQALVSSLAAPERAVVGAFLEQVVGIYRGTIERTGGKQ